MTGGRRMPVPAAALAAACIALYFLVFAGRGIRADISYDDLMNLYGAWKVPVAEHLRDAALFFFPSPTFRPAGSIFYRLLFEQWQFQGLPYRMACYALLLLNLGLAYLLVRRFSGERLTAGIAVLLFAYHAGFVGLYTNTGMVYDLLCFFFYTAAFLYYLRARQNRFPLGWGQVGAWSCLYILALDSKEMAVSLPVLMGLYELGASPPAEWRPAGFGRWLVREGRAVLAGGALTGLYIWGRVLAPAGLNAVDAYRPDFSPQVYLDRAYHFLGYAFYEPGWLTPAAAAAVGAVLVLPAFRCHPAYRIGAAWMLVGILPIAFIRQRDLSAAYLPSLGLAICLAVLLTAGARRLQVRPAALFAGLLMVLAGTHARYGRIDFTAAGADARYIRSIYEQLRLGPPVPRNGRVLILNDPFPNSEWSFLFLLYLHTRDAGLTVHRRDLLVRDVPASHALGFDAAFSYEGGRLVRCAADPLERVTVGQLAALPCHRTSLSVLHSSLYESRILRRP